MNAREIESMLVQRCTLVARAEPPTTCGAHAAQNQREANVFRLAALLVQSRFPGESKKLFSASETYFAAHPQQRLPASDVLKNGWVLGLPRLRDMLREQLSRH